MQEIWNQRHGLYFSKHAHPISRHTFILQAFCVSNRGWEKQYSFWGIHT